MGGDHNNVVLTQPEKHCQCQIRFPQVILRRREDIEWSARCGIERERGGKEERITIEGLQMRSEEYFRLTPKSQ
jgi:hypothetical protein